MTLRSTAIYHAKAALSLMQMRGTMDSRLERVTLGGETRFRFTYAEQGESYVVILRLNASIGGAVDATATKEANAKQAAPEQAPVAEEAAPVAFAIPRDTQALCAALIDQYESLDAGQQQEAVATSGTPLNLIMRAFAVQRRAKASPSALASGLIGVGLITYAESRLARFAERVARVPGGRV